MTMILREAKLGFAAALLALACGGIPGEEPYEVGEDVGSDSSALTTTANQSLLITMTSVTRDSTRTEDPCSTTPSDENKVWSIGHLLKREAEKNGIVPSTYVNAWMNAWTSSAFINGQMVPPLNGPNVRTYWQRFAGGSTGLPLHKAPFYLLAIVNRPDLRKHRPLGEPLGGEVRFVFGILGASQNNPPCPTVSADPVSTIILEYSPAKADENQVRDFHRRWLDLSTMTGAAYRTALQNLTEEVVNSGRLLRIRTNDGPIGGKVGGAQTGWDFVEFEPNATTKLLQRSTIKQSPSMALAGGFLLMSDWIWANRAPLYQNAFDYEIGRTGNRTVTNLPIGSYSVPNQFPGTPTWFRGAMESSTTTAWSPQPPIGLPPSQSLDWIEARFRFSVGTCSGCHGSETGTAFLHIHPGQGPGFEAARSDFLKGTVLVVDPVTPTHNRTFNEMGRRENDLRNLVDGYPVLVPVFGNNYTVRFRNSGKCMDSEGDNGNENAFSVLWPCHGNRNQRLSLVSAGNGVYNLKYKHSGKCIDVLNGSTSNGARVVQATCNANRASQKLSLSAVGGSPPGTPAPRLLKFQHSNLCLVVQNQSTSNGTWIVQATCPGSQEHTKAFDLVE